MTASQYLLAWQKLLNQFLPSVLQGHAFVMKIENGVMHIAVPNGAFATRLRQYSPTLLKLLNQPRNDFQLGDGRLVDLSVSVRQIEPHQRRKEEKKGISRKALTAFTNTAAELPNGSSLQTALLRLIKHHKS